MMSDNLTPEERKIIFHSVKYWQMHKASFNGKEYQICDDILNRWFDDDKLQQKENSQ